LQKYRRWGDKPKDQEKGKNFVSEKSGLGGKWSHVPRKAEKKGPAGGGGGQEKGGKKKTQRLIEKNSHEKKTREGT